MGNESIKPADLKIERLLWIFAILSVVFLVTLSIVPVRAHFTEWRAVQQRYNVLAAKASHQPVRVSIQQIYKPELGVVDRCTSCHLGMGSAGPVEGDALFQPHPHIAHEPRELGCTICHRGQGRATSSAAAHGSVKHWDKPILGRDHVEAGCGACHSHATSLQGAPRLMAGKALANQLGCRGCHRINGVGGDDGPDLEAIGARAAVDLDFSAVRGPRTLARWLFEHILDPARVVPNSRMPDLDLTEQQAGLLTTYMLSLQKRPIPEAMVPVDRVRGARLGERDFPTDGRSLYGVFCAACHGELGQGRSYGGLESPFPAIGAPDFLAVAEDELLRRTIAEGRPGRRMPAWGGKEEGLRPAEIDAIVAYLRSLAPRPPTLSDVLAQPPDPVQGARIYANDCAVCHGRAGEGSALGPPLSAPDNTMARVEAALHASLSVGVPGTSMRPYAYDDKRMRAVIAAVLSLPETASQRAGWAPRKGDPAQGRDQYMRRCAGCHGARGEGKEGPALLSPAFRAAATDAFIAATIVRGRAGTSMPAFSRASVSHPALTADDVVAIVAFLRAPPQGQGLP